MDVNEIKKYIDKLCTLSNNYHVFDENYIKNKFDLSNYNKFRKYYKKNHTDKLIFNSLDSEKLFIKLMNLKEKKLLLIIKRIFSFEGIFFKI